MKRTSVAMLLVLSLLCLATAPGCGKSRKPEAEESKNVIGLSEATFDQVTGSGPVLVDFWAPWCPPCRVQGPVVGQVADAFVGKAKVCKLNVDEAPAVARRFAIQSIPTLIVLKDGKETKRFVGFTDAETLSQAINAAL